MIIELNIGLPDGVEPLNAVAFLVGPKTLTRVQEVSYRGPDGSVRERTLIARIDTDGVRVSFLTLFRMLCKYYEQDCIAVYIPHTDDGFLTGPRAAKWGAFDKSKFIQYVVAPAQQL